jgi:hypothetical protein
MKSWWPSLYVNGRKLGRMKQKADFETYQCFVHMDCWPAKSIKLIHAGLDFRYMVTDLMITLNFKHSIHASFDIVS